MDKDEYKDMNEEEIEKVSREKAKSMASKRMITPKKYI